MSAPATAICASRSIAKVAPSSIISRVAADGSLPRTALASRFEYASAAPPVGMPSSRHPRLPRSWIIVLRPGLRTLRTSTAHRLRAQVHRHLRFVHVVAVATLADRLRKVVVLIALDAA